VINKLRGILNVCAVKAPGFGDRRKAYLGDIAVLTGGTPSPRSWARRSTRSRSASSARPSACASTRTDHAHLGGGQEEAIEERVAQIRAQIEKTTSDYDREKLEERLAKLTGGVAVIKVGGDTEAEMKSKKDLVDDALNATRAAIEEGIVPGGGVALLCGHRRDRERQGKGDERFGAQIIEKALEARCADRRERRRDGSVVVETCARRARPRLQRASRASTATCSRPASSTRPRSCARRCRTRPRSRACC
jgi:chaperonin GroEL